MPMEEKKTGSGVFGSLKSKITDTDKKSKVGDIDVPKINLDISVPTISVPGMPSSKLSAPIIPGETPKKPEVSVLSTLEKKKFEMPKIKFEMPSFKNLFSKKSSEGKSGFFNFSGDVSWKGAIGPAVLILSLTGLVILNGEYGKMLQAGNDANTTIYNQINESIPRDEMDALIKTKRTIEAYDNVKTSLTMYEIWNFLSRIIPKSNASDSIQIRDTKITVTYTDAEFESHLALQNTLEDLKKNGLIKSYKSEAIEGNTTDDLTTYYQTTINLDAGMEKDVGVRKVSAKDDTGSGTTVKYRAILEKDRGSDTETSMIRLREFLEKYSKGTDPMVAEFLQFKK